MAGWFFVANRYPFTYSKPPSSVTLSRTDYSESVKYVPERTCRNTSDSNYFRCSVCRKKTYRGEEVFNYCPNCGAKVVDE